METTLTAILIDDEESAIEVLSKLLIRFCPNINIISTYSNLKDGVKHIKNLKPDVVFLDIEMPYYAGYEIVNLVDEINFEIIFVTAFDKYAIKAFEVAAVDYLLKPIDIDRLKTAVSKLNNKVKIKNFEKYKMVKDVIKTRKLSHIFINEKGFHIKVHIDEIIAIEADKSYSWIHTVDKKYMASKNLKHFENLFNETPDFFRVHKSWLINFKHIISYSKSNLELNLNKNIVAKLSKYKKNEFETAVSQNLNY